MLILNEASFMKFPDLDASLKLKRSYGWKAHSIAENLMILMYAEGVHAFEPDWNFTDELEVRTDLLRYVLSEKRVTREYIQNIWSIFSVRDWEIEFWLTGFKDNFVKKLLKRNEFQVENVLESVNFWNSVASNAGTFFLDIEVLNDLWPVLEESNYRVSMSSLLEGQWIEAVEYKVILNFDFEDSFGSMTHRFPEPLALMFMMENSRYTLQNSTEAKRLVDYLHKFDASFIPDFNLAFVCQPLLMKELIEDVTDYCLEFHADLFLFSENLSLNILEKAEAKHLEFFIENLNIIQHESVYFSLIDRIYNVAPELHNLIAAKFETAMIHPRVCGPWCEFMFKTMDQDDQFHALNMLISSKEEKMLSKRKRISFDSSVIIIGPRLKWIDKLIKLYKGDDLNERLSYSKPILICYFYRYKGEWCTADAMYLVRWVLDGYEPETIDVIPHDVMVSDFLLPLYTRERFILFSKAIKLADSVYPNNSFLDSLVEVVTVFVEYADIYQQFISERNPLFNSMIYCYFYVHETKFILQGPLDGLGCLHGFLKASSTIPDKSLVKKWLLLNLSVTDEMAELAETDNRMKPRLMYVLYSGRDKPFALVEKACEMMDVELLCILYRTDNRLRVLDYCKIDIDTEIDSVIQSGSVPVAKTFLGLGAEENSLEKLQNRIHKDLDDWLPEWLSYPPFCEVFVEKIQFSFVDLPIDLYSPNIVSCLTEMYNNLSMQQKEDYFVYSLQHRSKLLFSLSKQLFEFDYEYFIDNVCSLDGEIEFISFVSKEYPVDYSINCSMKFLAHGNSDNAVYLLSVWVARVFHERVFDRKVYQWVKSMSGIRKNDFQFIMKIEYYLALLERIRNK